MQLPQIVEFVRLEVKRQGYSRDTYFKKIGYAASTFQAWIAERRSPKVSTLIDALEGLGYEIQIVKKGTNIPVEMPLRGPPVLLHSELDSFPYYGMAEERK